MVSAQKEVPGDLLGERCQVARIATSPWSKPMDEERNGRDGPCSRRAPPQLFKHLPLMTALCILLLCLFPIAGFTKDVIWEQEELAALNRLIDRTRTHLDEQLHVKELFLRFEERQQAAMKNPDDREAMSRMVVAAAYLLEAVQEAHLTHLFSTEFLEELQAYYRIFHKKDHRRS